MRKEREPTELGRYVLARMVARGLDRQVDLARAAKVSDATVNRLIYATIAPEPETIRKLAGALGVDEHDFVLRVHNVAAIGPTEPIIGEDLPRHPLAVELDRMLAPESHIPEADREALETLIDRLIDPYRRMMRGRRRRAS